MGDPEGRGQDGVEMEQAQSWVPLAAAWGWHVPTCPPEGATWGKPPTPRQANPAQAEQGDEGKEEGGRTDRSL